MKEDVTEEINSDDIEKMNRKNAGKHISNKN